MHAEYFFSPEHGIVVISLVERLLGESSHRLIDGSSEDFKCHSSALSRRP